MYGKNSRWLAIVESDFPDNSTFGIIDDHTGYGMFTDTQQAAAHWQIYAPVRAAMDAATPGLTALSNAQANLSRLVPTEHHGKGLTPKQWDEGFDGVDKAAWKDATLAVDHAVYSHNIQVDRYWEALGEAREAWYQHQLTQADVADSDPQGTSEEPWVANPWIEGDRGGN